MADIVEHLIALLLFITPAYAANMAAPFARFWPGWNRPIHDRLLGSHKTVVGALLGIIAALAVTGLQATAGLYTAPFVDYRNWITLGLAFGIGAMAGDAIKSGFKRRRGRPPGTPWVPADQLDFMVGALVLVGPFASISALDVVVLLVMTFVGDLAVNRVAFRLGIKDTPW